MVPVTNKLLIPCRVLDSHFCRLSDSVLTSPSRPPSSLSLSAITGLFLSGIFSLSQSESLGSLPLPTLRLLLLPMYTHPSPCRLPCNTRLAPCPRPTRSTTATPPSRRHFLGFSHSSCSSLLFCSYTKVDVGCMLVQMYLALDSSVRKAGVRKTSCGMITRLRVLP